MLYDVESGSVEPVESGYKFKDISLDALYLEGNLPGTLWGGADFYEVEAELAYLDENYAVVYLSTLRHGLSREGVVICYEEDELPETDSWGSGLEFIIPYEEFQWGKTDK